MHSRSDRFCSACGQAAASNDRFCGACGKALVWSDPAQESDVRAAGRNRAEGRSVASDAGKNAKASVLPTWAIAVIIIGALGVGAWFKDYAARQRAFAPMRDFLSNQSQGTRTPPPARTRNLLRVVNVPAGRSLAIMSRAGGKSHGGRVVMTIGPGTGGIVLTGSRVRIGDNVWTPVRYRRVTGWIDDQYLTRQ